MNQESRNNNIQSIINELKTNFPKIDIKFDENERILLKLSDKIFEINYLDLDVFFDITQYFKGFSDIKLPVQNVGIIIREKLYFFCEIEDFLLGMIKDERGIAIIKEEFKFHYKGLEFQIEINEYPVIFRGNKLDETIQRMKKQNVSEEAIFAGLGGLLLNIFGSANYNQISFKFNPQLYISIQQKNDNGEYSLKNLTNSDLLNMANTLIFEYYYNHGIMPRLLNFEELPIFFDYFSFYYLPTEKKPRMKEIIYRPIDPILLYLLYVADLTPLPFYKFLSYYRVIEYFYDKFSIFNVSEKIRDILIKPDFLYNKELYTEQIFRIVSSRDPRRLKDKKKLRNILERFISLEFLSRIKDPIVLNNIKNEITLEGGLILQPIIINDKIDYNNLTNRIYDLRSAIVHSNPDYAEEKKVIVYNIRNLIQVWREGYFLRVIAVEIVGKASAYLLK